MSILAWLLEFSYAAVGVRGLRAFEDAPAVEEQMGDGIKLQISAVRLRTDV